MKGIFYDGIHYDGVHSGVSYDINFWLEQAKRYGEEVLELACGTGRITIPLAKEGVNITGIDIAESMCTQARNKAKKEGINIEILQSDIRDFNLGKKFSLIFIPANSIAHLTNIEDIEKCLYNVKNHLKENGKLILDTFNPSLEILTRKFEDRYPNAVYPNPCGEGDIIVNESSVYNAATQINKVVLYYKFADSSEEKTDELNLRIYFPQELEAILKYNGFKIDGIFGDYDQSRFESSSNKQILVCSLR